uniref:Zinc finger BED domain-containing protein 1-like n=1 Tax=Geotrypetes seraphini TaxID=260995 RepID=A0A6P8RYN6_GEOSA|nr:zinc finger BED domain-containing protein 1-like [Geotrypetes seraphini]XP_033810635.1 zinc finger BED domain-containing protein 1-like [Geotrypetes seraphini]
MADLSSQRGSEFLHKGVKCGEDGAGQRPLEEVPEDHQLSLLTQPYLQTVEEEISMAFHTYNMAANLGPSQRRKREKGMSLDGGSTLSVDRRKSKVWNYYTKLGDAYVECNVCKKQLSFHNSTTTMREHLVRKHSIRDTALTQLKEEPASEPDCLGQESLGKRARQMTPENTLFQPPVPPCSEPRTEMVLDLVLEMIFRDLHPLSVVEDKGFRLLMGYLEPGFSIPSPVQLASMLWHKYNVVKQHLEHYLHTAQAIVLSLDIWASQPNQTYLTISANFIDCNWRLARCILETQPMHGHKGDDFLGEKLCSVLAEFELSPRSVFCVMHDQLSNMLANSPVLRDTYGWTSLCCTAHMLHICISTALQADSVQEALAAARDIISYFQQDAKATCSLNTKLEAMSKTKLKLILDMPSRWITTLEMCESLLDLKWAIMSVLEEHTKGTTMIQNLADHQWKLLQDLLPVMRTIKIAASFLREEQNASTSSLMPCMHGIMTAIRHQCQDSSSIIKTVVSKIISEINQHWDLEDEGKLLESPAVVASFLDPRFKEVRFLSPAARSQLHSRVKNILSQVFNPQALTSTQPWLPSECKVELGETSSQVAHDRALCEHPQSIYDILLGKDPTESMPEIHQQLENYIVEPLCKRSTNPLCWWRSNEHRFPAVAKLAQQYLAIPATAVIPERAFAAANTRLEHRRAVLTPEHLDQILFLNQNLDFLESMKNNKT